MIKPGSIITSQTPDLNTTRIGIDLISDLGLNAEIASVVIMAKDQELINAIESAVKREVNRFNKNKQ